MKPKSLLCLFMLPWSLVCCDKNETTPAAAKASEHQAAGGPGEQIEPVPSKYQSKQLPPGSQADYDRYVKAGGTPTVAHDTPPMDKNATGIYSYLGAARLFREICGFDLPDWVEPVNGNFFVSIRNSGPVRQSRLKYMIDPARRAELEKMIVEASEPEANHRHKLVFLTEPIYGEQSSARLAAFEDQPAEKVKERTYILLKDDGTVTLRVSRGPVGWDE